MNFANRVLSHLGVRVVRATRPPSVAAGKEYESNLQRIRASGARGYRVIREPTFESGSHPSNFVDFECEFASAALARANPREVLDIGSYRIFVRGLTAGLKVTSIDIRSRAPVSSNERVLTCDAKSLPLPESCMDAVVSLCALEHFGLGRYGDEFDPEGDLKAIGEMKRVLRPSGTIVLSTSVTAGPGAIAFNAHRIYPVEDVRKMLEGLTPEAEQFYSMDLERSCQRSELRNAVGKWDVYCGSWRKPAPSSPLSPSH